MIRANSPSYTSAFSNFIRSAIYVERMESKTLQNVPFLKSDSTPSPHDKAQRPVASLLKYATKLLSTAKHSYIHIDSLFLFVATIRGII